MNKFDDLIRQGEDVTAYKMLINELYNGCKIGGTRKRLMERVVEQCVSDRYIKVEILPELIGALQEATDKLNDIPHGNLYMREVEHYRYIIKKARKELTHET